MSYKNIDRKPKVGDIVKLPLMRGIFSVYRTNALEYSRFDLDCTNISDKPNDPYTNYVRISSKGCELLNCEQIHMFEVVLCYV